MNKTHNIIITVLFCGFIGIMGILTLVLPKQEVSVNEKRILAKMPQFSLDKVASGKWEKDFEGYISDHFPARDVFAGGDAYFMLYTGRNGSNGIYSGKNGFLFQTPVKNDKKNLDDNIEAVNSFATKTGIPTKLMVVPSAGYIMPGYLPQNHKEYKDGEIISEIGNKLQNVETIDITGGFSRLGEAVYNYGEQLYYKTDHHWTSDGAYLAYKLWCRSEGIEPRRIEDYNVTKTDGFYGTSYSKSALWLTKPDTIETWEYPINVTVTIDSKDEYDSLFFKNHLTEPDQYPVYLDGNHEFERIINHDNPNGKKILLIKDSYAHTFAPFLAENCSQIDMVDLRYYFDPVSRLTEKTKYDEVLVLYGISNICETSDLSILE